jgi:hypothetical protein
MSLLLLLSCSFCCFCYAKLLSLLNRSAACLFLAPSFFAAAQAISLPVASRLFSVLLLLFPAAAQLLSFFYCSATLSSTVSTVLLATYLPSILLLLPSSFLCSCSSVALVLLLIICSLSFVCYSPAASPLLLLSQFLLMLS